MDDTGAVLVTLASRGAVLVTSLLFAALRAEHCYTPLAPLRGVPGPVRLYGITVLIWDILYHLRDAPRRTPLPK